MGNRDEASEWRFADEVLGRLLDLPPTARRDRLRAMELAPAVRVRVERMLAALREDGDGILDRPERVAAMLQADALSGRRLGRWRLAGGIGPVGVSVGYSDTTLEGQD